MGKVADLSVFTPGGQPGAPTPSEGLAVLRQNQTAFMETIGAMPPESLTIVDGAISPTTAVCIVDTEGDAPADDLTIINSTLSDGGTLHDGMVILLSAKDASRVVTVKNSDAPNGVKTVGGKDIALSTAWSLVLQYVGGTWQQISISAPLKPATKTTLGGVMVGDGLTALDGTLSADLATAEAAGRVKASEAAKAGAVPLGGADGSLGEDWLKVAMEKATAAKDTADKALDAAAEAGKLSLKAQRTTAGDWTITGLTIGKPLYILANLKEHGRNASGVFLRIKSGADGGLSKATEETWSFFMGVSPSYVTGNNFICVPTSETVVVCIEHGEGSEWQRCELKAYQ